MSIDLHTADRLVYQFYPVTSNQISFKIKAPHDAHIILSSANYESQPCYEVFFGGWENTKSVIRKNRIKPDVVEVATPQILSAHEYRGFWVRWEYGWISAGTERDYNPIMKWYDPQLFNIQYFGVCTGWGASGHWIIDNHPALTPGFQHPHQPTGVGMYPSMAAAMSYQQPAYNPALSLPPQWVPGSLGSAPPNAVIGGNDINGEAIYIARATHEGALVPGKMVKSHRGAFVAWGGRENSKFQYEVLCGGNPRWVPVTGGQIPHGAFVGGRTENGETLYVGRAHHNGSLTPGKVQLSHKVCYIPFGGREIAKSQFEVMIT